jgi:hypothetical protein
VTADELNDQCIARLEQADLSRCLAVVGSGPSRPHIAPISTLEDLLANRCGIVKEQDETFWNFAQRAHVANANQYFGVIRQTYGDTPYWSADVYLHLVTMPFKGFATFNYDDQLPKAFRRRYPETYAQFFSVYPPHGDKIHFGPLELLSSPPRLIALHGYCDPNNPAWEQQAILRTDDYNQHYGTVPAPLFEWWRNLLLAAPCLFIGTSLTEPGLFRVIQYLLPNYRDMLDGVRHIHLVDVEAKIYEPPDQPGRSMGIIEKVCYDPIDPRYSGLLRVLSEFSKLPTDPPTPRVPALKPITPTDKFDFTSP